MANRMHRVNLSDNQLRMLIFVGNGGDIRTLHPTAARSLRYAVKALIKASERP
jgi:hypothetical protein